MLSSPLRGERLERRAGERAGVARALARLARSDGTRSSSSCRPPCTCARSTTIDLGAAVAIEIAIGVLDLRRAAHHAVAPGLAARADLDRSASACACVVGVVARACVRARARARRAATTSATRIACERTVLQRFLCLRADAATSRVRCDARSCSLVARCSQAPGVFVQLAAPGTSRRSPTAGDRKARRSIARRTATTDAAASPHRRRDSRAADRADRVDLDKHRRASAITTRRRSPTAAARCSRSIPSCRTLAEKLLDESRAPRGAIVAMAPDGRILALAGRRTDEPKGGTKGTFDWHLATDVWAPAASVFKLVTASALVADGVRSRRQGLLPRRRSLGDRVEPARRQARQRLRDARATASRTRTTRSSASSRIQNLEPERARSARARPRLRRRRARIARRARRRAASSRCRSRRTSSSRRPRPASPARSCRCSAARCSRRRSPTAASSRCRASSTRSTATPSTRRQRAPRARRDGRAARSRKMMVGTCESGSASRSRSASAAGQGRRQDRHARPRTSRSTWSTRGSSASRPPTSREIIVSVLLGNPESWHLRGHEAAKRMIDRAIAACAQIATTEDRRTPSRDARSKRDRVIDSRRRPGRNYV